jgi:hypothetical protein
MGVGRLVRQGRLKAAQRAPRSQDWLPHWATYATLSTSTAFRPPKANELESAYSTC